MASLPCKAMLAIAAVREGQGVRDAGYFWAADAESLLEAAETASIPLILLSAAWDPLDDGIYWILFW